jgi:LysM repeat protein
MIYFFINFSKEQVLTRVIGIFILISTALLIAQEDIVLVDDSKESQLIQKDIKGCVDSNIIISQKRQIRELKRELKKALRRLSKMEQEISSSKFSMGSKSKRDYIVVRVKRGDTLSKYAKRFYGDEKKYYKIYRANRNKIGRGFKLRVGDKIIIPLPKRNRVRQILKKYKKNDYDSNYYIINKNSYETTPKSQIDAEDKLKMLDEIVYIDEDSSSQKDIVFIPLDEN